MVISTQEIWEILEHVNDPEIPVLSIIDLGIVRDVIVDEKGVEVVITPTYSGCPAMDTIEKDIKQLLVDKSILNVTVKTVLSPAWTTDWLTERGKERLENYGIAPPAEYSTNKKSLIGDEPIVKCPQCKSHNTVLVSQFGSTACKAHYKCKECLEPFDYFKCL